MKEDVKRTLIIGILIGIFICMILSDLENRDNSGIPQDNEYFDGGYRQIWR